MKSVNIVNEEVLSILNEFKDLWWDKRNNLDQYASRYCPKEWNLDRDQFINEDYKNKIVTMGHMHEGFPETMKGWGLKWPQEIVNRNFSEKYVDLNAKFQTVLGTKHNSLCAVYPPGGYIAWHTNANASAYNVIFTWSENGDGYWKHIDPHTKEEVTIPDVPGWQCKAGYFGSYDDKPEDLVYHMASTDCWRMTIGYIFDREHVQYWKDVIEEIETP